MGAIDWRWMGVKSLVQYLASAEGEGHDAAVYDTGYEFDPQNKDAVRFIASVAMTKAALGKENFRGGMPTDGSVVPVEKTSQNERIKKSSLERACREENSETLYIPDAAEYQKLVQEALKYRRIHISDMTGQELEEFEERQKRVKRSDARYMALHYYLPTAFAILTLIYIIYLFTH